MTSTTLSFCAYQIRCGIPALAQGIVQGLKPFGWQPNQHAGISLLIDGPWGFALKSLEQKTTSKWVIVTDNPCPEYTEDLWSYEPNALLVGAHSAEEIVNALERTVLGEFFRCTPLYESPLSSLERKLLRYSAKGWENQRIAQTLNLKVGTVRNGLSRVFQKLGFENRAEIALYYWGLWHLLENNPVNQQNLIDS